MELSHHFPLAERQKRNSASNPVWMDGLRILLGLFLFVKGVAFLNNSSDVFYLISQQPMVSNPQKASLFFSTLHIIGGLMIAFGALTRFALLFQIPVVLGAVLIVNMRNGLSLDNLELWLSMLVLALCLLFMIKGPGRYSIDNKVFRPKPKAL